MEEALKEAKLAYEEGEVPVGAVVVFRDEIIGRGHNTREKAHDISGHAEIKAIQDAEKRLGKWQLDGCELYVTLEPCLMCSGAILQSRIKTLCFGASDPEKGAIVSGYHVFDQENSSISPVIVKGTLERECKDILDRFFKEKRR